MGKTANLLFSTNQGLSVYPHYIIIMLDGDSPEKKKTVTYREHPPTIDDFLAIYAIKTSVFLRVKSQKMIQYLSIKKHMFVGERQESINGTCVFVYTPW